jgi:two-component system, cell cycle sensor histidine kinase and response regulator CckA
MKERIDPEMDGSSGFPANVSNAELRATQIAQLYSQVHVGMISAIVAACALAALLWNSVSRDRILLWMVVFLVVQIPRHHLVRRFHRKQPQGAEVLPWGTWFLAGSGITALLFGMSAVFMFPRDSFVHQCVLATFLGGFAASTTVAHAPLKECYVSSVLLTLLPLLGRFLYQGGESGYVLAAVGLVFAGALLGTGNALHRMIASSIRLRVQRDETISKLQQAREVLEDRVAERTADLAMKNNQLLKEANERSLAQRQLHESEERYRDLFENALDAIYTHDLTGRFTSGNSATQVLLGVDRDRLLSLNLRDVVHQDDLPQVFENINQKADKGVTTTGPYEIRICRPDGTERWIEVTSRLILEHGEPAFIQGVARDFTDRKHDQDRLKASEAKYRNILETIADGYHEVDLAGNLLLLNDSLCEFFGYSRQELMGKNYKQLLDSDTATHVYRAYNQVYATGVPNPDFTFEIVRKDGSRRYVSVSISLMRNDAGQACGFRGAFRDVTMRRRAEEAVRSSEERLRLAWETNPDYFSISRLRDAVMVDVNNGLTELTGYRRDEVIGKSALDLNLWVDLADRVKMVSALKADGQIRDFETKFRRKDGEIRTVSISAGIMDLDGEPHLLALVKDIEEKKRAEAQIRLNEERLQSLYDISQYKAETVQDLLDFALTETVKLAGSKVGYIYLYDEEKKLFELNTWSKEVMKECQVAEPQTRYELDKTGIWGEAVRQRKPIVLNDFHAPNKLKKGYPEGHVPLHNFMTIPVFEGDKIVAVVGVANKDSDYGESDVRQLTLLMDSVWRIAAAKRYELVQRRAATALEHAVEGVIITDTDGTIQYVNSSLERMTGYSQDELLGSNPRILKSGEQDGAFYEKLWGTIKSGYLWTGRFVNKRKDGSFYTEDATISPVRDGSGTITGFVGMKRDITEHLALSQQLLHAQKMEAVGTLAGGMAHDFNNLLQAILGYTEILLMKKEQENPDRKKLEIIQHAARDGADLVSRILAFSKKSESKVRPIDLNQELRRIEKLLRRTLPQMIKIDLVLSDDLRIIDADPAQIEQVVLNLGVNAQHAMLEGGQLLIETCNVSISDEYIRTHLEARKGKYVLLTVSDTGTGMASEVQERIFEPFFTTKINGEGTGLGLSMVHGIVTQHGGYIRCYSEPGRGTSFKIYFPVSKTESLWELAKTREMPAFGTETLLLVDDDDRVRNMAQQMIEMGGYKAITASSGEEALEIYAAGKEEIALVILDLIMPGMGGKRCLEDLLRIDPDVRVIIASGLSSNGLATDEKGTGARGFVMKPYDAKEILRAIRKVLDQGHL